MRLNWVLKNISSTPDGLYKLDYDTPSGPATLRARSVAMTIPAWVLADIIKDKVRAQPGGGVLWRHSNVVGSSKGIRHAAAASARTLLMCCCA